MLPEHKNPIFVSKRPKMSEKSPILTQKPRFCARKAGKWGSRSQKAHKNADFVLGGLHRTARRDPARQGTITRNGTRPPGTKRNGPKHNETQPPRNTIHETQPPRNATHATQHTQRNRHATQPPRNTQYTKRNRYGNAKEPLRNGTTKKETTFRVVSFKNWRLPTLPHGSAVPSAQVSLTSLFGMGRGGSSPLLPP